MNFHVAVHGTVVVVVTVGRTVAENVVHEASLSMQIFRLESQICPPLFQLLSQSHPMSVCSISLISMDSENKFAMATVSCNAKTKSDNVGVISSGWGFNRQKGDRREPNIAVKWLARKESTGRKCRHLTKGIGEIGHR